jgi:hypothetical protein
VTSVCTYMALLLGLGFCLVDVFAWFSSIVYYPLLLLLSYWPPIPIYTNIPAIQYRSPSLTII